ncbi:MAG: hypothetical protein ACRDT1_10260 [Micromonosporaceae bacterium]
MTEERAHDPATSTGAEGIPDTADDDSPRGGRPEEPQRIPTPGDVPVGLDEYGTTASETRHGEPLSGKLNREEPDVPETPTGGSRLVEPDEGVQEDADTARRQRVSIAASEGSEEGSERGVAPSNKDMVGRRAADSEDDLSAEEAAVAAPTELEEPAPAQRAAPDEATPVTDEPTG